MARQVERARAVRDAEQRQRHADAAARAAELWAKSRPADPRHPYLVNKRVKPHAAHQLGERLVLPVTTLAGKLVSLQFIHADGGKRLLSGGRKRGCCVVVADPPTPWRVLICEGWATGASLAEADPAARVLAAVDAGNLEPVALAVRERWPDAPIVLAGDADDIGRRAAHAAALAVGGLVLIPDTEGADWNDAAGLALAQRSAALVAATTRRWWCSASRTARARSICRAKSARSAGDRS
ncbi:toprim domain-containing protein, partial [Immundisolibacter sp.]|uniref:toprim domain-containing protein n=1 Tax=Immundisolibacter sp. TaxID=1934948 RepID=UPI0035616117